jgi:hypothetical protein
MATGTLDWNVNVELHILQSTLELYWLVTDLIYDTSQIAYMVRHLVAESNEQQCSSFVPIPEPYML